MSVAASLDTFDTIAAAPASNSSAIAVSATTSVLLNHRHDRLAVVVADARSGLARDARRSENAGATPNTTVVSSDRAAVRRSTSRSTAIASTPYSPDGSRRRSSGSVHAAAGTA